ncbi:MAG: response regulator, partial [Candidatus Saccharimonadales bacterium]
MNAKLLIIEDDSLQHKLYTLLCQRFCMQADFATNSNQACVILQQSSAQCEIILLDWMLGAENGLDCISRIRALTRNWPHYVPIIAVTAHALTGDRETCITAGADDYMAKPFSLA